MQPRSWLPERLEGELVVLLRHVPSNLAAFQRWYSDPEIARLNRHESGVMRRDEIERFFSARVVGPDTLSLAIHVQATGRLIGTCAFSHFDGDNGSALYHITIGEHDAWGRGYGTEATDLMLEHAFERLGLHRVGLSVFSYNERAIASYRKSGFVIEGTLRQAIRRDGRFWDEHEMGILADEWRTLRRMRSIDREPADNRALSIAAGAAVGAGPGAGPAGDQPRR